MLFKSSKLMMMHKVVRDSVILYSFPNDFFNQFTKCVKQHNNLGESYDDLFGLGMIINIDDLKCKG